MKKLLSLNLSLVLLILCGCTSQENKDTRFLLNTVVSLTASCSDETLDGAFLLCKEFESVLSRTIKDSDVYKLNNADDFIQVSNHTKNIIEKAVYYGDLSSGKFDITIYPVSSLWDFNNHIVPSRDEISEALKNVDYQSIVIDDKSVSLGGKQIDLGGIAKGYIADRLLEYFKQKDVSEGIIDLGGNIVVFGNRVYTVGIKQPFSENEIAATVKLKNKTAVTSGVYERYIKQDSFIYHHILDPRTGYACDSDLYSATIIADSSIDADALSTICILLGLDKAKDLIEKTPNTEAIFIDSDQKLHFTSGLDLNGNEFTLK